YPLAAQVVARILVAQIGGQRVTEPFIAGQYPKARALTYARQALEHQRRVNLAPWLEDASNCRNHELATDGRQVLARLALRPEVVAEHGLEPQGAVPFQALEVIADRMT